MGQNLKQFDGKKVVLVRNLDAPAADGSTAEEIEGTVITANPLGVLIKPKGKTQGILVEADKIEGEIRFVETKAKKLTKRWLKDLEYGNARQHLISAHGYKVSEIDKMTEQAAFDFHKTLDHSDLGHQHGEKPAAAADDSAGEGSEDSEEGGTESDAA